VPLLLLILLSACAAPQPGRSGDRISGVLVLAGTEQPLGGVRVVLLPVAAGEGGDPEDRPGELSTSAQSNAAGGFVFGGLDGVRTAPLLRGWTYELRAEAEGFAVARRELRYEGGDAALRLELELIADDALEGQQILELGDDSIQNPAGTLIDEVLRKQGRLPRR
jgi:hypothetical protein